MNPANRETDVAMRVVCDRNACRCEAQKLKRLRSSAGPTSSQSAIGSIARFSSRLNSADGRIAGFVNNDAASLHHPTHFVDGDLDVSKWIALDGNNVGDIARRDRTQRLLHP